jgi:hypothetical protein
LSAADAKMLHDTGAELERRALGEREPSGDPEEPLLGGNLPKKPN